MQWLIGTWVGEMEAPEGLPGLQKGDKVALTVTCRWTLGKNVIESHFSPELHGTALFHQKGMLGWDGAKRQLVGFGFDSVGGHSRSMWTKVSDTWHIRQTTVHADGTTESVRKVLSEITSDRFTSQWFDRRRNGKPLPDGPKIHLRRKQQEE